MNLPPGGWGQGRVSSRGGICGRAALKGGFGGKGVYPLRQSWLLHDPSWQHEAGLLPATACQANIQVTVTAQLIRLRIIPLWPKGMRNATGAGFTRWKVWIRWFGRSTGAEFGPLCGTGRGFVTRLDGHKPTKPPGHQGAGMRTGRWVLLLGQKDEQCPRLLYRRRRIWRHTPGYECGGGSRYPLAGCRYPAVGPGRKEQTDWSLQAGHRLFRAAVLAAHQTVPVGWVLVRRRRWR